VFTVTTTLVAIVTAMSRATCKAGEQMVTSQNELGQMGGHGAFERFVLPEVDVLLRVARGLTRHDADAEDLVQDTLLRAYRAIDRFDGRHPRAWLFTILRNAHLNHHRRRRPTLLRDGTAGQRAERAATGDAPDAGVDATFEADVEQALRSLTPPFRQVVSLVDIGGLSYADAARVLDVAEGTVMSRLHRARRNLRRQLADRRAHAHDDSFDAGPAIGPDIAPTIAPTAGPDVEPDAPSVEVQP
jgi:RNA polymerase sigma-70 factor, ECF subfamily